MKPHENAEVPTGVIVGSVIAGLLLLLVLVAVLWKVRKVSYLKGRSSRGLRWNVLIEEQSYVSQGTPASPQRRQRQFIRQVSLTSLETIRKDFTSLALAFPFSPQPSFHPNP